MLNQGRNTNFITPFDRGFTSFFDDLFSSQFAGWSSPIPEVQFKCSTSKFPLYNAVIDKETKNISLAIALAGYEKEDLKVKVEGDYVVVSSKGKEVKLEEGKKFLFHDITQKSFEVKYQLPTGKYDVSNIDVSYINGILGIEIPAKESEKPKEIQIK